jgi:hypothetical protein
VESLRRGWKHLAREQRVAAIAALILLLTLFLPWYQKSYFDTKTRTPAQDSLSGFGSADFVMASVVLVALGVLALLWVRGQERGFHLPFGDGIVIMVAGARAGVLIFYRVLDHPDVSGAGATIGIQWGVFVAFLAAAFLVYSGYRIHAAHRAEPPLPETGDGDRPAEPTGPTVAVDIPPRRRGERPRRTIPTEVPPPPLPDEAPTVRRRRPRTDPPTPGGDDRPMPGQMSFDEAETQHLPEQR